MFVPNFDERGKHAEMTINHPSFFTPLAQTVVDVGSVILLLDVLYVFRI